MRCQGYSPHFQLEREREKGDRTKRKRKRMREDREKVRVGDLERERWKILVWNIKSGEALNSLHIPLSLPFSLSLCTSLFLYITLTYSLSLFLSFSLSRDFVIAWTSKIEGNKFNKYSFGKKIFSVRRVIT